MDVKHQDGIITYIFDMKFLKFAEIYLNSTRQSDWPEEEYEPTEERKRNISNYQRKKQNGFIANQKNIKKC